VLRGATVKNCLGSVPFTLERGLPGFSQPHSISQRTFFNTPPTFQEHLQRSPPALKSYVLDHNLSIGQDRRFLDVFAQWFDVFQSLPLHIPEHLPTQLEGVGVGSCRQFCTAPAVRHETQDAHANLDSSLTYKRVLLHDFEWTIHFGRSLRLVLPCFMFRYFVLKRTCSPTL
jgi:hypothetical protein